MTMSSKLPQNDFPVTALRNLGPKSAVMLAEAGIRTIGELRAIGAAKAYVRVKAIRSRGASVNLLWSMAAGLDGRGWPFQRGTRHYFLLRSAGFAVERNVR
jgi:hypothetical protein